MVERLVESWAEMKADYLERLMVECLVAWKVDWMVEGMAAT